MSHIDITQAERDASYARDNYICAYCGIRVTPGLHTGHHDAATLDHIVTRHAGGADVVTNLVTACASCNSSRGKTPLQRWYRKLAAQGIDISAVRARVARRHRGIQRLTRRIQKLLALDAA